MHPGRTMTSPDISKLSVAEKLLLMERPWGVLRTQADSSIVPAWHQDVLAERLQNLDNGSESISSWAQANERIRTRIKAD
jgi:hypothetical protein